MHAMLKHFRDNGSKPRFHGNGFIQLQIDEAHRLHLWHSDFPMMPNQNAFIHNHVWPMWSRILLGRLTNRMYEVKAGIAYGKDDAYDAYYIGAEGPRERAYDCNFGIRMTGEQRFYEGSSYHLAKLCLHSSHTLDRNPVLTLIRKGEPQKSTMATVICPHDEKPYDAFQPETVFPEEKLWACLNSVFGALSWANLDFIQHPDFHDVGPPL